MAGGWIKIHRSLFDHPVWANSSPEHKVILMTILGMVNHTPNKWVWKGEEYEVQQGQVITSLDSLAAKSGKGVTRQNVRTALKNFVKLKFLTNETTRINSLISVVNWGIYQGKEELPNTETNTELTQTQHRPNTELTPNKEGKNVKEEKEGKKNSCAKNFKAFYEEYPKKKSRQDAEKAFFKLKPSQETINEMMKALEIMKKSEEWEKEGGKFIPHPASWINKKRWEDDLESYHKSQDNDNRNPFLKMQGQA